MQIIKINPKKPEAEIIKQAAQVIIDGGVVVYPTDTAYGLAADALNEKAIGKLFIMKRRMQKPLPVIIDSPKMLDRIADVTPEEQHLMKTYWPGALTIIFKKKGTVPPFLTLGLPTIGVRIPDAAVALALVKACDRPLTSTSANITGRGNCYSTECVTHMFQESESLPDLILDAGELPEIPVSTVAQIDGKKVKILRDGPIKIKTHKE